MSEQTTFATGLRLGDNNPNRSINCPHCRQEFKFNSNALEWDTDDTYEFTNVHCRNSDCRREFEISAASTGVNYTFLAMK